MPVKKKPASKLAKRLIIYGGSGIGKTELAGNFPNCGFIIGSQEQGVRFHAERGTIPQPVWIKELDSNDKNSFDKLIDLVYQAAGDTSIQTLVCETITDFEGMCFLKDCYEKFAGDMSSEGFFNYSRGPRNAAKFTWPDFVEALETTARSGKDVILTAHSSEKEAQDPQGAKFLKYHPYCDKDIWQRIHKWASGVFLVAQHVEIDRDKKKQGLRQVAREETNRLLYVSAVPFAESKNWHGLKQTFIHLGKNGREGYENLSNLLR